MGDANAELSRTDLSNGIDALLAIRLRFIIIAPSLPHAANGRFKCDDFVGSGDGYKAVRRLSPGGIAPMGTNDPKQPAATGSL